MLEVPRCGSEPKFHVGDEVIVTIVYQPHDTHLLDYTGEVECVCSLPGQFNYTVSGCYLNEQMLGLVNCPHNNYG